jgi:toxin ParE1/3/4
VSLRPLIPREQAARDVDDAVACHLGQDAPAAAPGLIDALAYAFITRQAAAGSARWAHELKLRGLPGG